MGAEKHMARARLSTGAIVLLCNTGLEVSTLSSLLTRSRGNIKHTVWSDRTVYHIFGASFFNVSSSKAAVSRAAKSRRARGALVLPLVASPSD